VRWGVAEKQSEIVPTPTQEAAEICAEKGLFVRPDLYPL